MNKTIKNIILKINPFAVDYQVDPPLDLYTEAELEKLAMLIVRECIIIAINQCPGDTYEIMQEFDARFGVLNET
jgi:hypothetical protein